VNQSLEVDNSLPCEIKGPKGVDSREKAINNEDTGRWGIESVCDIITYRYERVECFCQNGLKFTFSANC
jgi:hypothetical protein